MLTKGQLQQMSDSQLQSYVMNYARQNKMGDMEAADMLRRFQAMKTQAPSAPSAGVTKGRNKPRRMGKTQGYNRKPYYSTKRQHALSTSADLV